MRVLWAVGGLLVSTSALADDVRYSLQAHHLVADVDGTSIMVDFPCDEGYAVVAKGNFVFVACGAQGVAVYDAHDRSHPTFKGRSLYEHPCLDLTADGECLAERHVTYSAPVPNVLSTAAPQRREPVPYVLRTAGTAAPLRREPVDTSVRDAGIACVAIGGAAFLVGVVIDVAQMVSAFNGFCLFGCASQSGPPAAVGWAGFATWTLGLGVALVGIPLWVGGARHHVAAYATFGGGGPRLVAAEYVGSLAATSFVDSTIGALSAYAGAPDGGTSYVLTLDQWVNVLGDADRGNTPINGLLYEQSIRNALTIPIAGAVAMLRVTVIGIGACTDVTGATISVPNVVEEKRKVDGPGLPRRSHGWNCEPVCENRDAASNRVSMKR